MICFIIKIIFCLMLLILKSTIENPTMKFIFCAFVISNLSSQYGFVKTSEYVKTSTKAISLSKEDFHSIVFNKSRYVFVYFYSSSCSECEDYSDVMDDLGDHMRTRHNIIIASADIDKVDVGELKVKKTPSFKLIKTGNNDVVDFTKKTKTVETFAKFLEQHARVSLERSNSVRDRVKEREEKRRINIQHTDKFRRDEL